MSSALLFRLYSVIVLISWAILFYPSLTWFADTLFNQYQLVNFILLAIILVLCALKLFKNKEGFKQITIFQPHTLPLLTVFISSLGYILASYFISMNIINCMLCIVSAYGMLGFFIPYPLWKKGFIPVILVTQTLPFGHQLDIYFGFPLRLHAAEQICNLLNAFQISGVTKETIITIENRSAEISAACSGLNGLWTAWLFYFFLTWIEKRSINKTWILFFVLINVCIYCFNLFRIFILVVLESVFDFSQTAKIIHVPLGIIGFIFSCFITWYLMNLPIFNQNKHKSGKTIFLNQASETFRYTFYLPGILTLFFITLTFFRVQGKSSTDFNKVIKLEWPMEAIVSQIDLQQKEKYAFKKEGCLAHKYRFSFNNLSGTCLISFTHNWRAHHPPDLCTQGNGYAIEQARTVFIEKKFPVNILELQNTNKYAIYWFQSGNYVTQDHAARVWESISSDRTEWAMVSILFEQNQEDAKQIEDLLIHLRKQLTQNF